MSADQRDGGRRGCPQRGSVLMLMPAAVLVVIILGAIAVDSAHVFNRQRALISALQGAANDAAGAAVDRDRFYGDGTVALDPIDARRVVRASMAASGVGHGGLSVSVGPEGQRVTVTASSTVDYIFADAVPGTPATTTVTGEASAVAEQR